MVNASKQIHAVPPSLSNLMFVFVSVPVSDIKNVIVGKDCPHVKTKKFVSRYSLNVQCSLTYPDYSLIWTPVWEPIPIPQQKVTHLSGNSVIWTVSLGTEVSG